MRKPAIYAGNRVILVGKPHELSTILRKKRRRRERRLFFCLSAPKIKNLFVTIETKKPRNPLKMGVYGVFVYYKVLIITIPEVTARPRRQKSQPLRTLYQSHRLLAIVRSVLTRRYNVRNVTEKSLKGPFTCT